MEIPPAHRRLRNIKLMIEYDGTRFIGWQVQPKGRTVAGVIEHALADVIGEEVRLVGAGRTDEGVHAEGQIANFLSRWKHPADGLAAALNERLPEDVGIIEAADVGPEFHARHSASVRVYRYHVVRRRSVFQHRRAWAMPRRVDLKRLRDATTLIVGMHDFAAFTDQRLAGDSSTKVAVTYAGWKQVQDELIFRIAASHYLARMVRRLVGTLVRVGTGELAVPVFREWLETGKGEAAPLTAPAMGLYLEHVEYPPEVLRPPERNETHPVAAAAVAEFEREEVEGPASPGSGPSTRVSSTDEGLST